MRNFYIIFATAVCVLNSWANNNVQINVNNSNPYLSNGVYAFNGRPIYAIDSRDLKKIDNSVSKISKDQWDWIDNINNGKFNTVLKYNIKDVDSYMYTLMLLTHVIEEYKFKYYSALQQSSKEVRWYDLIEKVEKHQNKKEAENFNKMLSRLDTLLGALLTKAEEKSIIMDKNMSNIYRSYENLYI